MIQKLNVSVYVKAPKEMVWDYFNLPKHII